MRRSLGKGSCWTHPSLCVQCGLLYGGAAQIRQIGLGHPNSSAVGQTHSASQTVLTHSSSSVSASLLMLWQLWGACPETCRQSTGNVWAPTPGVTPKRSGGTYARCKRLLHSFPWPCPCSTAGFVFPLVPWIIHQLLFCLYSLKNKIWVNEFRWVTAFSLAYIYICLLNFTYRINRTDSPCFAVCFIWHLAANCWGITLKDKMGQPQSTSLESKVSLRWRAVSAWKDLQDQPSDSTSWEVLFFQAREAGTCSALPALAGEDSCFH